MSRHLLIAALVTLACAVALGGLVAAAVMAQAGKEPTAAVQPAMTGGGHYRLDGGLWQIRGAAGGPGYHLEVPTAGSAYSPAARAGQGTPCCCAFLPCAVRSWP
jgi:hypothetical protein